jgi:hypothetical protein
MARLFSRHNLNRFVISSVLGAFTLTYGLPLRLLNFVFIIRLYRFD